MADWGILGLGGDPAPGDTPAVRSAGQRWAADADVAARSVARLRGASGAADGIGMVGDYAPVFREALSTLPGELSAVERSYRRCGHALTTFAGSLDHAQSLARTALRRGVDAQCAYDGELHRIRTVLPPTHALDLSPRGLAAPAVEAGTVGLDEGLRGQIRVAAARARQATAEKDAARRLALQAAEVRGDAEIRAVRDLDDAAEGVRDASFWQQAWNVVSSPFRSWDGFVDACGALAVVLSIAALFFGGPVVWALFAVSAVLAAATAVKVAQHRAGVGELAWSMLGVIPGGAVLGRARLLLAAGPVARFVAPLRRLQAMARTGAGRSWGSVRRGAMTTLSSLRRTVTKDPIDLASGEVVLTQVDLSLPGALPLLLKRTHVSSYRSGRWFGPNWASSLDEHLEIDSGVVHFARADGSVLTFPLPTRGEVSRPVAGEQLELTRVEAGYVVTDPRSGVSSWFGRPQAGDGPDAALMAIVDRNGHRIDVDYGGDGQLLGLRHSGGYHVVLDTADERVHAISLLRAGGDLLRVVAFGYDEAGRLAAVVNSSGLPLRFEYDDAGRMTRWEDRNGNWYAYSYDELGRCVQGSGIGGVLDCTLEFDPGQRRTTYTDSLGQVTTYRMNEAGRVISVTDPLGGVELTDWDAFDQVVSHTDAHGATTRYDYAPGGVDLVGVRRADGARVQVTYEAHLPVDVVEADGLVWRYRRDERGNLVEVIDPTGASVQYLRRDDGCVVTVVDPLGHRVEIEPNPAGLPTRIDAGVGRTVLRRDAFGRLTSVEGPAGVVQTATYSPEGWLTTLGSPGGELESWVHDGEGNVVQHRDGAGRLTRTEYGWFDQPSAVIRPDGSRLSVQHDSELRLTALVDPLGREWTYAYDAAGRLVREQDVNGRELRYRRDAVGRVVSRINPLGQQVGYRWDVLGRLVVKDVAGVRTEFGYDLMGRLVSSTGPDTALTIELDALGRVVAESWDGRRVDVAFDAAGHRVSRVTPSGARSTWSFDAVGQPLELSTAGRSVAFRHDAAGREVGRRVGGLRLGQEWNAAGQLVAQYLGDEPAGEPAQLRSYRYAGASRLVGVTDRLRGLREFTLDALDRVIAVASDAGCEDYGYDPAGTLALGVWPGRRDGGSPGGERRVVGTMIRRAGDVRCHHDRAGRVTTRRVAGASGEDRVWRYSWDAEDRLVAVLDPDGGRWRYRYDGLGRRVAKQRLGEDDTVLAEETFVWDGVRLAEHVASDGRVTTWDWHPDRHQPVTQVHREPSGGHLTGDVGGDADEQDWFDVEFYAIVTDLIGTPTELVDDAGQVVWHSRTTLWGASADDESEPLCPLRFPGQYRDTETGLDYTLHRYYDPLVGAFLSPDPLGLQPGPNPHSYVPNPTTWTDPLGLTPCRPLGFASAEEFENFGRQLYAGLDQAGHAGTTAVFQGSSVTGFKFTTGEPFDVGRLSDFDISLVGRPLLERAVDLGSATRSRGMRTAPLTEAILGDLGLADTWQGLERLAGRDVHFMAYRSIENALGRGPGIVVPR